MMPLDPYAAQFPLGEAARILDMKPSVLAMWGQRGLGSPTRREGSSRTKKRSRQGRGLFSARDMVKIKTQQILADMGFSLNETVPLGDKAKLTTASAAMRLSAIEAEEVADTVTMKGEWMWAVARAFEAGKHLHVYVYASPHNQKEWQFDMHVGDLGEPPCFGWTMPHIYLPMSDIFIGIYTACKKMLKGSVETPGEDV